MSRLALVATVLLITACAPMRETPVVADKRTAQEVLNRVAMEVAKRAGNGAIDCGIWPGPPEASVAQARCMSDAYKGGKPFYFAGKTPWNPELWTGYAWDGEGNVEDVEFDRTMDEPLGGECTVGFATGASVDDFRCWTEIDTI